MSWYHLNFYRFDSLIFLTELTGNTYYLIQNSCSIATFNIVLYPFTPNMDSLQKTYYLLLDFFASGYDYILIFIVFQHFFSFEVKLFLIHIIGDSFYLFLIVLHVFLPLQFHLHLKIKFYRNEQLYLSGELSLKLCSFFED